eukprot:577765-Amphidinium_carterae.1
MQLDVSASNFIDACSCLLNLYIVVPQGIRSFRDQAPNPEPTPDRHSFLSTPAGWEAVPYFRVCFAFGVCFRMLDSQMWQGMAKQND